MYVYSLSVCNIKKFKFIDRVKNNLNIRTRKLFDFFGIKHPVNTNQVLDNFQKHKELIFTHTF